MDAQPFLAAVCAGMSVGELLHGETFSLFDSTTAIEIGDAKMDAGFNRNEEVGTVEELIAGGAAPVSLPPRLLLAVMDRLLVLEATWHAGSMLPQTVFTSLYMLQPDRSVVVCGGPAVHVGRREPCWPADVLTRAGSASLSCPPFCKDGAAVGRLFLRDPHQLLPSIQLLHRLAPYLPAWVPCGLPRRLLACRLPSAPNPNP